MWGNDSISLLSINLSPYLFSFLFTLSLAIFTFRRRMVPGALAFSMVLFIETLGTGGYILELLTPTLPGKMGWDNFQWFTTLLFPVATLFFTFEYIGWRKPGVKLWLSAIAGIEIFLSLLIATNAFPGLGIQSPQLVNVKPFPIYDYQFGPLILGASAFSYLAIFCSFVILIRQIHRQSGVNRLRTLIIFFGLLIPTVGACLAVFDVPLTPYRDISPFTLFLANILLALGLFRYHIFDLIPVARGSVMDFTADPVVVLDSQELILETNPAFENLVNQPHRALVKQPLGQFLPSLPPLELSPTGAHTQTEYVLDRAGEAHVYEVSAKPFTDHIGVYSGRLLILHDITRRKRDEKELRLNNDLLEDHVRQRTHELEVLYQLALDVNQIEPDTLLNEFLAWRIKTLTQAFFVSLAVYNPVKKQVEPIVLVIKPDELEQLVCLTGFDPRTMPVPVSSEAYQAMLHEVVGYSHSLSELTQGLIPPEVGNKIDEIFQIEKYAALAFVNNGALAAIMVIALHKNRPSLSHHFFQALANLISVAFWRIKSDQARRESETRFQQLAELLPQGIFECTQAGMITYANQQAARMVGFEAFNSSIHFIELFPPDQRELMRQTFEAVVQGRDVERSEFLIARRDGSLFPALIYSSPIEHDGQITGIRGVIVDITRLKETEQDLQRTNQFLRATSRCNQALVHAPNRQSLFNEVCATLVEEAGYSYAWIGLTETGTGTTLLPVAQAGSAEFQQLKADAGFHFHLQHCTPMLEAIMRQEPVIIAGMEHDLRFAHLHTSSQAHKLRAMISLPLVYQGHIFGGISVYSSACESFSAAEIKVLQEMSSDVSFGIHTLQVRADRDQAIVRLEDVNQQLIEAYDATLQGWSRALELRERETAGHSLRVVSLTLTMAEKMGIPPDQFTNLRWGAYLHDIGKIGIPDSILLKPDKLSDEEWQIMRQHPEFAYRLIAPVVFLQGTLDIPYLHHERWDGSGYPRQLKGKEIPLAARIFAIVDVWDALVNDRPYRPGWSIEATRQYLLDNAGVLFDPEIVPVFLELVDDANEKKEFQRG